jgi:hypothetical protein
MEMPLPITDPAPIIVESNSQGVPEAGRLFRRRYLSRKMIP